LQLVGIGPGVARFDALNGAMKNMGADGLLDELRKVTFFHALRAEKGGVRSVFFETLMFRRTASSCCCIDAYTVKRIYTYASIVGWVTLERQGGPLGHGRRRPDRSGADRFRSKLEAATDMMPTNEYVEVHNGGYYVAGTRIGLDVVAQDFRRGRSAEAILDAYPSIGSLAKVYGAITFILEHPAEVDAYLADQERCFEEIKARYPMPAEMIERLERGKAERSSKLA
jgi:uncharacterized protein (DUF433 family)